VAGCTPRASTCDPVCNTGCTSPNRCDIASAMTGQCLPAGTGTTGSSCTASAGMDSCQARNSCLGSPARCYRLCYVDGDCLTGQCCNIDIQIPAGTSSGFRACGASAGCNPTVAGPGTCGAGNACYFIPCSSNTSNTDCASAGTTATGLACTYVNDCTPGDTCVSNGTSNVCRQVCLLAAPSCATGTCMPLQIGTTPSTVYGVCQ